MPFPLLQVALVVAACSTEAPAPPPVAAPPPPPAAEAPAKLDLPTVSPQAEARVLAPSPLELERAVRNAGVTETLAHLVPTRQFKMDMQDKNAVAVQTGVMLADVVLTGRNAPKDEFIGRLRSVRQGMATLGAGAGLLSTIDGLIVRADNEALSRDEFLAELDDVASMAVPEQGWGTGDRSGPLLQAGAWLEGTNLVARALLEAQRTSAATALLRQPEVPDYFLRYVRTDGAVAAPGGVLRTLTDTLVTLSEIARKPDLGPDDVQTVVTSTNDILSLL